jgi:hypothetical protein
MKSIIILLSFSVLMITGCVTATETPQASAEAIVSQRAEARWAALIEGRLETAYTYLSPASKQTTPYVNYQQKIKGVGIWKQAKLHTIECEGARCQVVMNVVTSIRMRGMNKPLETAAFVKETWIHDAPSDQWYYVQPK